MAKHLTFADANSTFEEARFVIFGVPFDLTCSFRSGTRHGPHRIREESYNFESYMFEHGADLHDVNVHDAGNTEEFGSPELMVRGVREFAQPIADAMKFPIMLGGEHSISSPVVACFEDIGVISLDAHLDFRDSYLGEKHSHACSTRRMSENVGIRNIVPIGIRSFSKEEKDDMDMTGLQFISSFEVMDSGIEKAVERALGIIEKKGVYLSLDIDAIDPAYSPAVGNPEPFGLTSLDVKKAIDMLADRLVGFDLVEVSPPWDSGNTASLAARLVREVIMSVAKK